MACAMLVFGLGVQAPSTLNLLLTMVVCMKVNWVALLWRARR